MRAFKSTKIIAFTTLILLFNLKKAAAQEEGVLIKKSPQSNRTSAIEILPYGILVGEFDGRAWNYPYNGLFLSRDLGESWIELGLEGRGVTDIAHMSQEGLETIFVSTYYSVNNTSGIFKSSNQGQSFQHAGISFATSNVEIAQNNIIIGGYSHGLWISQDNGQTWDQKIGTGWYGPQIVNITAKENIVLASTTTSIYISYDGGLNWSEIKQLEGEQIHTFLILDNLILAGCRNNKGIFRSQDGGSNWERLLSWGNYPTGKIISFQDAIYVSREDTNNGVYNLFKSLDRGDSWEITNVDPGIRMKDIKLLYSYPAYFYISTQLDGVHRYALPMHKPRQENFLDIPWTYSNVDELTDKITAYFDHQYPLLGYVFKQEDKAFQDSTVSFFGFNYASNYFYSSHNGVDFALPYGKSVLAAEFGLARYYSCDWCGHSIKIDHQNGYETVYMHLQKEGLISNSTSEKVWVEQGSVIGKIGMTGKSSGPHLHFGVLKDSNGNGYFDDYPDGLVDPFAWIDPYNTDPWPKYNWEDGLGYHSGTESLYLWQHETPVQRTYINLLENTVSYGNKSISFNLDDLENNLFTASIANYIKPKVPYSQYHLEYIKGTSFTLTAADHFEKIVEGSIQTTVEIDLTNLDLNNVVKDTIKVYVWDALKQKWEPLPTIYDHVQNKLTAETSHLSHFAVFGDKLYPISPSSSLLIDAEKEQNWYSEAPTITILAQDNSGLGIKRIFYSLNDGLDWQIYEGPFVLENEGVTNLLFRTEDMAGNLELTNSHVIKVDTLGKWKDVLKVVNNEFTISF